MHVHRPGPGLMCVSDINFVRSTLIDPFHIRVEKFNFISLNVMSLPAASLDCQTLQESMAKLYLNFARNSSVPFILF